MRSNPMITTTSDFSPAVVLSPELKEQELVRLSQGGNQEAFACLYDNYIERIYRYIYYRVADDEIADDITSQVFLKAWEKLASYQAGSSPFIALLYLIAHNSVFNYYVTRKPSIHADIRLPAKTT